MSVVEFAKRTAMSKLIDYLLADPENNMEKMMDRVNAITPKNMFVNQRQAFTHNIKTKNNWYQLLMRIMDINPEVRADIIKKFVINGNFIAWGKQEKSREKYQCNIPWAILLDPTSACNLHCVGCWAADYGHSLNLSFEDIDSIITQGKELGVYTYIYTGGEPLVRKKDVIKLCEKHDDCVFLCFTNSTLIDEEFIQDMIRVKNFIPAISAEGFEETTDARRGKGTYKKIEKAMHLLKEAKLPFGISICYTSQNAETVCTEEYWDWMIDEGAYFCWIFTYMPIGKNAPKELMATAEQRELLYHFNREMRDKKPIFGLDFWNDGEFVGGCIAGGRRYLHINAAGDVEPCVFAHYANANIHDMSLLDALRSPLFMAYYNNQPFNDNLLRPCPILDNEGRLAEMVEETGAHPTDYVDAESAEELCEKCHEAMYEWAPVAERLWTDPEDPRAIWRDRPYIGMSEADIEKFETIGRKMHGAFDDDRPSLASELEEGGLAGTYDSMEEEYPIKRRQAS